MNVSFKKSYFLLHYHGLKKDDGRQISSVEVGVHRKARGLSCSDLYANGLELETCCEFKFSLINLQFQIGIVTM